MLFDSDDECAGCWGRQRCTHRKICPRDQSLRQARDQCELSQPPQSTLRPSLVIHKSARSVTPTPISFDALSKKIPLKGCVLWKSSCVHGENHASAIDKRGGRVWSRARMKLRKPLDEHVFVLTLQSPPVPTHCEQYGANLCCPRSQPETTLASCTVIQKHKNPPKPKPCEAVPQGSRFSARPTTTNHTSVPESKACEHDEASLRWQHWQK